MGRVEPTTGIVRFTALVNQVMTSEPYASARRVFWVADNGSSHRGQASIDRITAAWPNAVRCTCRYALLARPAEVVFYVLKRQVIQPADFNRWSAGRAAAGTPVPV